MDAYGRTFAGIGMAEKGTTNVVVTVEAPGGHSSVPPAHTASEFRPAQQTPQRGANNTSRSHGPLARRVGEQPIRTRP